MNILGDYVDLLGNVDKPEDYVCIPEDYVDKPEDYINLTDDIWANLCYLDSQEKITEDELDSIIVVLALKPDDVLRAVPDSKSVINTWPIQLSTHVVYLPVVLLPCNTTSITTLNYVLSPYAICNKYGGLDIPNMVEIENPQDYNRYYINYIFMTNFEMYWELPILSDEKIRKVPLSENLPGNDKLPDVIDIWYG